jgi:adenylate cyclase
MEQSGHFLPQHDNLHAEVIHSEYKRSKMMLLVLATCLLFTALDLLFGDDSIKFFGSEWAYIFVIITFLVFVAFEVFVLTVTNEHKKRSKKLSKAFILSTSMAEVGFPSVLMAFLIHSTSHSGFLDSPLFVLYFVIMLLSALHLDENLCLLVSFLSASGYFFNIQYALSIDDQSLVLPAIVYYMRVVLIIFFGYLTAFVSKEMRRRIHLNLIVQDEKRQIERSFGQQVSPEIAAALRDQGDDGIQLDASILVLDIRDFSSYAHTHSPAEILEFQNKVFEPIIDIIEKNHGVVNQILGDGIMACFGAPARNPNHVRNAYNAAIAILKRLKTMNEEKAIDNVRFGIGIHTGPVITGNIGNENRKQYSITGTPVIIAFRLEQLNKTFNSQLIISRDIYQQLYAVSEVIQHIGEVSIKGLDNKIDIYQVAAI